MLKDNRGYQSVIMASGDDHHHHYNPTGSIVAPLPQTRRRINYHQNDFLFTDTKSKGERLSFATRLGNNIWRWLVSYIFVVAAVWGLAMSCHQQAISTFEITVGGTMRIPLGPLWSRSILQIDSPREDPGVAIYEFAPLLRNEAAECPLLNGPSLLLESQQTFSLNHTEFSYDTFHLNAGSIIMLNVRHSHQRHSEHRPNGLTNVYLLRGYSYVESLRHHDLRGHDFRAHSIRKELVGHRGGANLRYEVDEDDFYTIVYCNDSWDPKPSHLKTFANITVATHSLENVSPVCTEHQVMNNDCYWDLRNARYRRRLAKSCFIAKAESTYFDSTSKQQKVVFQVGGPFRYELLLWSTACSLLVGLLWAATSTWLGEQTLSRSSSPEKLLNEDTQLCSRTSSETSYESTI